MFAGVRREEDGEVLRREPTGAIEPLLLDVTDAESIAAAGSRVEAVAGGGLAGVINNAGVAIAGPLEAMPIDDFRRQVEVNLTGQLAVTQRFLPLVRAAHGRIVLISSVGGRVATPFMGAYHAAKFGLEAVGDSLRQELKRFGVEVVIVEPGTIATPIWTKGADGAQATRERLGSGGEALYGKSLDRMEEIALRSAERGIPAEKVAAVVLRGLTARRPRTRYPVGLDAHLGTRVRRLAGDRLMDRLIARATGL